LIIAENHSNVTCSYCYVYRLIHGIDALARSSIKTERASAAFVAVFARNESISSLSDELWVDNQHISSDSLVWGKDSSLMKIRMWIHSIDVLANTERVLYASSTVFARNGWISALSDEPWLYESFWKKKKKCFHPNLNFYEKIRFDQKLFLGERKKFLKKKNVIFIIWQICNF